MHPRPSAQVLTDADRPHEHPVGTGPVDEARRSSAPTSLQQRPTPSPSEISSTYLAPADLFPTTLAELERGELHVLHSRIARQLDREYRTDPAGPHPVTLDRAHELVAELDTRQDLLERPRPAPARIETASRGSATTHEEASGAGSAQAPGGSGTRTRTRRRASTPSRRHDERPDGLFPYRDEAICRTDVRVQDLDRLWPGDQIEIWHHDQVQCVGIVEQTAPALGVVWIRDARDGYRRMLHLHDTVLRYHLPVEPRRTAS